MALRLYRWALGPIILRMATYATPEQLGEAFDWALGA